jgi:5'-3' exonuclease
MTIILLDAKNAMFRFGWAFKNLKAEDGTFTGASYGILKLLMRLKRKYPDGKFVMVWDGAGKSWRHKFWEGYKANRVKEGPIAEGVVRILAQIPTVAKMTAMMGIPQLNIPCVEGDDAIGLLAHRIINDKQHKVVVYSSDKDFIQLMSLGVKCIQDADVPVNLGWVNLKFRCAPEKVVLVRAIAGDKSDGIPGIIDGVGTVKAAALIEAGLNPSYMDFEQHDLRTQRAMQHLIPLWDQIHRNYRLMRILDFKLMEKIYDKPTCGQIYASIDSVLEGLQGSSRTETEYRLFLKLMGQMDLVECIADRYRLWHLQRITL